MARDYPYPPRMMTRARAAAYCDLSIAEFEREVAGGTLPMPIKLGSREHWDRHQMDEALSAISGERVDDWRSRSRLYG